MDKIVYFDNNATTKVAPEASRMIPFISILWDPLFCSFEVAYHVPQKYYFIGQLSEELFLIVIRK